VIRRWTGFDRRIERIEEMERSDCDPAMLRRTYAQFERLNALISASRPLVRRYILRVMAADPAREHTLLDVGAGGGDVARWLVRQCRKRGWRVRVTALEPDPRVLPLLTDWSRGYPEIEPRGETLERAAAGRCFDFVFSNHVLHHVPQANLRAFITTCHRAAGRVLLLSDLRRSLSAWLAFHPYGWLFLRRSYAFPDGLISLRRSYTPEEMAAIVGPDLAAQGVRVATAFPARLLVLRACDRSDPDAGVASRQATNSH
jgi:2-polyprenyl-3-methyl-5-hydroxy-6-metoxy-1,4-benzoquinol methylase